MKRIYFTLIITSETSEIDLSKVHGLVFEARNCSKSCQGRASERERKSYGIRIF